MKILNWILNIGKTLGDKFISWDIQAGGPAGYTDSGGWIHLQNQGTSINANALIHEGVEAYYAIQYGVRSQASQQMDYLAQRYSGMYKSQSAGMYNKNNGCDSNDENCQFYGAYGLSFQQWRATADGKVYAGQPPVQAVVQFGVPIAPGHVLYRTGPFGLFLGAKAVNGGSIAELDAAYSEVSIPQPIYDPAPAPIV